MGGDTARPPQVPTCNAAVRPTDTQDFLLLREISNYAAEHMVESWRSGEVHIMLKADAEQVRADEKVSVT